MKRKVLKATTAKKEIHDLQRDREQPKTSHQKQHKSTSISQVLKNNKDYQPGILYIAKTGEIQPFSDKQKLREFIPQIDTARNLKGSSSAEGE